MKRPEPTTEKGYYQSPISCLEILGHNGIITSIMFTDEPTQDPTTPPPAYITECITQLHDYFQGRRTTFDLPISSESGTPFQNKVWSALRTIPYATTCSYSDLAHTLGNPKSVRAVGNANGKNRLSIVVPCHRVIGSNGSLTGYAGEIWRKEWLLQHEQNVSRETIQTVNR